MSRSLVGVRDPDFPCSAFAPGEPAGSCETDGHYLCDGCTERATCAGCGERPSHCRCDAILAQLERAGAG